MLLAGPARRDDHAAKADKDAGSLAKGELARIAEIARAVRVRVIVGALRAGEHDRRIAGAKNLQRHRRFFHRIGAMGDDDAFNVCAGGLLVDHGNELVEVRERNRGGIEAAKFHDFGIDIGRELRASNGGNEGTIVHRSAGNRAAGGDEDEVSYKLQNKRRRAEAAGADQESWGKCKLVGVYTPDVRSKK